MIRNKIFYTLLVLIVFRLGTFVPVPNVDATALQQSDNNLIGFMNTFGGGALANFSILALGIMPYITASIIVQLLQMDVVPKFTVIVGNSYGAGNYAMCGKAYDPRLIFAWPSAELAVMGGTQAAKVLAQIEASSLKKSGEIVDEEKEKALFDKIKARYDEQVSPYYAASRLWTDAIIDPLDTRTWISMGIEAANHSPIEKQFNLGVIQV